MAVKLTERKAVEIDENQRVDDWRRIRFIEIMPKAKPETIEKLTAAKYVSPSDLEKLISKGCKPSLAVKILL